MKSKIIKNEYNLMHKIALLNELGNANLASPKL
jgi:hypothetical protein